MKKFLLFAMMCVCVSIGAWAYTSTNGTNGSEKVVDLVLDSEDNLSDAISGTTLTGCDYLRISSSSPITLSSTDLTALAGLGVTTLDMQNLQVSDAFTFTNINVKNVILPDGWTKDQVKAVGIALQSVNSSYNAVISQGGTSSAAVLAAYVNTPGSLRTTLLHSGYDNHANNKLGNSTGDCCKVDHLIAMGNIAAKDICRTGDFDANGHFVPNVEAAEVSSPVFAGVGGVIRRSYVDGIDEEGAMSGNYGMSIIDLSEALIREEYNADLTLSWVGGVDSSGQPGQGPLGDKTRQVMLPTSNATGNVVTIPADFLNKTCAVHEICIPGHFENIKTRAFSGTNIDYVWTTGPDNNTRYDNGSYVVRDGVDILQHRTQKDEGEGEYNMNFQYGTYTLPPNLKLIERFAFAVENHVKDVYVLSLEAPECHVDAFNSTMYHANNHYDSDAITDGIITRDAYTNSATQYRYMTVLHYPRETVTPHIQRYTDPTRKYSVATGERDGWGNTIYFPNQSEYEQAFWQGTYGYLWEAWDCSRNWYDNELTKTGNLSSYTSNGGFGQTVQGKSGQEKANGIYESNTNTDTDKTDRSFYDVTLDEYYNSVLTQPAGLTPYYEAQRGGHYLYPRPVTEGVTDELGNPVMVTVPVRDEDGKIIYDPAGDGATYEGNYVRYEVDVYPENPEGLYCHSLTQDNNNGQWTIGYTYTENPNGGWVKASYNDKIYIAYESWMATNSDYANAKRYNRVESGFVPFTDQHGQPRFNIGDDYVLYSSVTSEYKTLLTRYDKEVGYEYREATSADATPFWTMRTEQVQQQRITKLNDYRGWHQFVLTAYAANTLVPFEPLKSFITDNDWWTICEPYDLRYNDMIKFFGTDDGIGTPKIPYLSKLMYVVRDVENQRITLMFSKNLMEYKEQFLTDHGTLKGNEQFPDDDGKFSGINGRVHGVIDDTTDEGKWTAEDLAKNPVILHAGVPYLIRPNLMVDAETGKIEATRQFDIYKSDNEELYNRLKESQDESGSLQKNLIYHGEYTVPAFVVGLGADGAVSENIVTTGEKSFEMKDGTTITYQDTDKSKGKKIKYRGKEVEYKISADNQYTFVGSFYKSVIPQYSYFLGWDSSLNGGKGGAAFWYSRVQDKSGWNWNNETGIICPNFDTNTEIHAATGLDDPARWTITNEAGVSSLRPDDFDTSTTAKSYTMDFGATNFFELAVEIGGIATSLEKINPVSESIQVYSTNGVFLGNSLKELAKGVYIVNGKKYVVK